MAQKVDISEILKNAEQKGYFEPSGYNLSLEQLKELKTLLDKKNIPWGPKNYTINYSKQHALIIINALRRGVPPSIDVTNFSVGRKNLIERLKIDLQEVKQASSRIRFMNADYGHGKTHALYLLREIAFKQGFVVSIVTLSRASCPIHDFLSVYNKIMWNLRTEKERNNPAIENVLDRWLDTVRQGGIERAQGIIRNLPDDLISALHAYHESTSPVRPNEEKRVFVLKYLSADKINLRDLRKIEIRSRIDSSNALSMLGHLASLFIDLNYRGICILFDEADPIHSFENWEHQDKAYNNLFQIIQQSESIPYCFFLYSTTPSFFDNYSHYWPSNYITREDIFELERLNRDELQQLAANLCKIYSIAYDVNIPMKVEQAIKKNIAEKMVSVGEFTRICIAILDSKNEQI